jgi:hypothetical protein
VPHNDLEQSRTFIDAQETSVSNVFVVVRFEVVAVMNIQVTVFMVFRDVGVIQFDLADKR